MPPWINKFYILDLREKNSFIKWATDQGHTVFVISWVNPTSAWRRRASTPTARKARWPPSTPSERQTGEKEVNAAGYCLGGTLLGTTLAYMAAKRTSASPRRPSSPP